MSLDVDKGDHNNQEDKNRGNYFAVKPKTSIRLHQAS